MTLDEQPAGGAPEHSSRLVLNATGNAADAGSHFSKAALLHGVRRGGESDASLGLCAEDTRLRKVFSDPGVAKWLQRPSPGEVFGNFHARVEEALVCGFSMLMGSSPGVPVETLFVPHHIQGSWVFGTSYSDGAPSFITTFLPGGGPTQHDRVSRFALCLNSGFEWYNISWFVDGSSILTEKIYGPEGICASNLFYCAPVEVGVCPSSIIISGTFEMDCLFCDELGSLCECDQGFKALSRRPEEFVNRSWADLIGRTSQIGLRTESATANVTVHGQRLLSKRLVVVGSHRPMSVTSGSLLARKYVAESSYLGHGMKIDLRLEASCQETCEKPQTPKADLPAKPRGLGCEESNAKRRNYACPDCKAAFLQKVHLDAHRRSLHEKLRPYACDRCDQKFGVASNLRRHQRNVHDRIRRFQCVDGCHNVFFAQKSDLTRHVRLVHRAS